MTATGTGVLPIYLALRVLLKLGVGRVMTARRLEERLGDA